ncbi:hypothetical protein V1512DRAFT_265640 [Lipomyces arxii]|uniref:uncharacterized protein n=1 Tax=Lipomyces arxii TaxID=56418 RepID=UPI0034CDFB03
MDEAERVLALLNNLQFPAPELVTEDWTYSLLLLQSAVKLLPTLTVGRDVAALSRMLLLSPSIWSTAQSETQHKRPMGLIVGDAFRTLVRARIQQQVRSQQAEQDDDIMFVLAIVGGISSCEGFADRQICALAGLMMASPAVIVPPLEKAYVDALNRIQSHQRPENDVAFAVSATIAYTHSSPVYRSKIRPNFYILVALLRPLFASHRHPEIIAFAGPLAQFSGHVFRFFAASHDLQACHELLSLISSASVLARGYTDAKDVTFTTVAVLCGLIDGIQSRTKLSWSPFLISDNAEVQLAKSILLIQRNISSCVYTISLTGFLSESYLHSATVGLLMACNSCDILDLIDSIQNTSTSYETLFALNTSERILLASPGVTPFPQDTLSRLIQPAKNILVQSKQDQTKVSKTIYEAAHAVFLASLLIPVLALENAAYLQESYIPEIIKLFSNDEITFTQFSAAVNAVSSAIAPGSGVLASIAPSLAEDVFLPTLATLMQRTRQKMVHNLFADAILGCAPVSNVPLWLEKMVDGRDIVGERIQKGYIPSVCAEGVVTWWFEERSTNKKNQFTKL